ncbi:MAG TPA: hypothetical protein VFZ70_15245 [Euzebyales bacterium]
MTARGVSLEILSTPRPAAACPRKWGLIVLVILALLLIAALVGAVAAFRRRTLSSFAKSVVVAVVIYIAVAFALELAATLFERSS